MFKPLNVISLVIIVVSAVLLSGCTPTTNEFYYHEDKGDCYTSRFKETDPNLDISFSWKYDTLYLNWTDYENSDDFNGYYIVRSNTNSCPYFYYGGSYEKLIVRREQSYFSDEDIKSGDEYYYRVCVLQKDKDVNCGGVSRVKVY